MFRFSLRLDDTVHQEIAKTAEQNRRSINNEIIRAIEYYLKHAPEAQYDPDILEQTKKPEA